VGDPRRGLPHNLEASNSHLGGEVVRGGFVIARDENFTVTHLHSVQLTWCGFTTKKPRTPRKLVIESLMKRPQDPLLGRGDRHTAILAVEGHVHITNIPRDIER